MHTSPQLVGAFWVTTQFALLLTWFLLTALGERLTPPDGLRIAIEATGALLATLGIALAGWGVYSLGPNLTPMPEPRPNAQLIVCGAFRYVRHPIYGGIILAVIGTTLIFLSPLGSVFIPIIIAFFFVKSKYEEERLGVRYGEYEGYVGGTKRFVPFLW